MPAHAGPETLQLFSHDLLQHMAIEREIRHQAFQLGILLTELPQFAQFTEAQPRLFFGFWVTGSFETNKGLDS